MWRIWRAWNILGEPRGAKYSTRLARFLIRICSTLRKATHAVWLAEYGAVEYSALSLGYMGRLTVPPTERQSEREGPFYSILGCVVVLRSACRQTSTRSIFGVWKAWRNRWLSL